MKIAPDHKKLRYSGRIDFSDPKAPLMVFPCSFVTFRFTGDILRVTVENRHVYWKNYIGYILDGVQHTVELQMSGKQTIEIQVDHNGCTEHECMIFKRMDACHYLIIHELELADGAQLLDPPPANRRRIEVYGDSVSAGEVSEAADYEGKEDPEHNGEYSNSWYSYAWMTARRLHAEIHDVAQGGIALLDGTGWFAAPDYLGMESIYDKITYNPQLGMSKQWEFSAYVPHVVIIALGQNDNHPDDYMAREPEGEKAQYWKRHYEMFVRDIHQKYPDATIILATTILNHDAHWDEAIDDVCKSIASPKVHHFLYSKNGKGTPGHIRAREAGQMAEELSAFIESLGEEIWE